MATPTLRPLAVGEILDAGIKLYLRHWKPLMICVVGIVGPVHLLSVLVTASVAPDALDPSSDTTDVGDPGAFLAAEGIVIVLSWVASLLATGACFKAISDAWLGTTPTAGRSLRFAARRLPALLWLTIVMLVALTLAAVALIVPFIWLSVAWALAVPALLFERVGALRALRRSFRLVRGRWWGSAATLVVGLLLVSLLGGLIELVLLLVPTAVAPDSTLAYAIGSVVGSTIGSMLTTPYAAAVITLLYFDQRVRKEGFDLQLLADGLGEPRDPDAPIPAPLIEPEVTPEQRAAAPFWPPPPGWEPPPAERGIGGWLPPRPPSGSGP